MLGCGGGSGDTPSPGLTTITGMISGIIRDSVTKQPVAFAQVSVLDASSRGTIAQVMADAVGRFSLTNVPQGDYKVRFEKPASHGIVDVIAQVKDKIKNLSVTMIPAAVTPPTNIDLVFPPPGIKVGQTAQFGGSATSGGQILTVFWTVQPAVAGGTIIGTISADGLFVATTPGVGIVQAQIGQTTATAQITVKDNATVGGIFGIVTDSNNAPVAGATVRCSAGTITTSDDGLFVFPSVAAGSYTITAQSAGATGSAAAEVSVNSVPTVNVQLR